MKQRFAPIFALIVAMAAFSCSKQDDPQITPEKSTTGYWFRKYGIQTHYDSLLFARKTAYLGGAGLVDDAWIKARSGAMAVADPKDAEIIILGNSLLSENESVIADAWSDGKVIIVCNPDLEKFKKFYKKHKWNFILPGKAPKCDFALCFHKNGSHVLLAPVHIMTSPIDTTGGSHPDIIYLDGEEKYEGMSVFSNARGLIQFINGVKGNKDLTKDSVNASALPDENTYPYSFTKSYCWDESLSCQGGGARNFRIFGSYKISYSIYPCHIHNDSQGVGTDYYTISAVASNFAPSAYEYSTDAGTSISGDARYWTGQGDKSSWGDCQYMGPYNSQLVFKSHALNPADLEFAAGGDPLPEADINSTSYSKSQDFSWNVGMSGGMTGDKGTFGFNVGCGGKKSNSVSYSVSDIGTANDHGLNVVSIQFNYQNTPTDDADFDNFNMPVIAHNTGDFQMSWQWTAARNDGDTTTIHLVTDVKQSVSMWTRDKVNGLWKNDLFTFVRETSDTNMSALAIAREPVGCLRINNECQADGGILYDIIIVDEDGQTVYSEEQNSVSGGEFVEVMLPTRNKTYGINLNMGKNRSTTAPFYSKDQAYTLEPMDSPDIKRIVTINENGADFSSDAGFLRVTNESETKLIMNLKVRSVDGITVLKWPNSIGSNQTAEISLTAKRRYYVTMDYGSASESVSYRSNEFFLSSFKSESDVKSLIATDTGGDFYEM